MKSSPVFHPLRRNPISLLICLFAGLLGLSIGVARAEVRLPHVFGSHMVLQREMPIVIWGWAEPGESVKVQLGDATQSAQANDRGEWKVTLPAMKAGGPLTLTVSGSSTVTLDDVMIGEVWLCSGQSNMEWTLAKTATRPFAGTTNWEQEVAAANHPQIREFKAAWTLREDPQPEIDGAWTPCTPATAGDFSAVAYFFARELQQFPRYRLSV